MISSADTYNWTKDYQDMYVVQYHLWRYCRYTSQLSSMTSLLSLIPRSNFNTGNFLNTNLSNSLDQTTVHHHFKIPTNPCVWACESAQIQLVINISTSFSRGWANKIEWLSTRHGSWVFVNTHIVAPPPNGVAPKGIQNGPYKFEFKYGESCFWLLPMNFLFLWLTLMSDV